MLYEILILICASFSAIVCQYDIGYERMFDSNTKEVEDLPLQFNMTLPAWLKGTYIRNGIGRFEMGKRSFGHAFDAFGKLSNWKFSGNGSCFFSTKFIYSDFYNKSLQRNDISPDMFLADVSPEFSELEKLQSIAKQIDNMNVNIYRYYDAEAKLYQYVLLNDCWKVYEIEPRHLTTLQSVISEIPSPEVEYRGLMSSAHPLPEPGTTNHIDFLTSMSMVPGLKHKIQIVRIKSTNVREQIAVFPVDELRYMHSFSVTENYAIFFLVPYRINLVNFIQKATVLQGLEWSGSDPINVYVVNIKSGKVTEMKTENGFILHHFNAYETDDSKIIIDTSVYRNPDVLTTMMLDVVHNKTRRDQCNIRAYVTRFIVNMKTNKISLKKYYTNTSLPIASRIDMPTINENYRSKEYCYVYGLVNKIDDVNMARYALAKKDLCGNTTDRVWYVPNHYPSEAWFVPRPGGTGEDDGVLLTVVLDGINVLNYLAVIDPKTMTTLGVANISVRNPISTHGRFFFDVY